MARHSPVIPTMRFGFGMRALGDFTIQSKTLTTGLAFWPSRLMAKRWQEALAVNATRKMSLLPRHIGHLEMKDQLCFGMCRPGGSSTLSKVTEITLIPSPFLLTVRYSLAVVMMGRSFGTYAPVD